MPPEGEIKMARNTLATTIIEAIDSENCESIKQIFTENPGQKSAHTFFGAQTWLGYAAMEGKLNSVKALIEIGVDVNAGDARDNIMPISCAADSDKFQVVKYLLEKGAELDVSSSVRNPLFAAIVGRSPRTVQLLLDAGIDSKVRYNSETMRDMDAVAFALMRGEQECANLIALWNADGNKETALTVMEKARITAAQNANKTP